MTAERNTVQRGFDDTLHGVGGSKLNQSDSRAAPGIFLGIRAISNEVYVGTPEGVIKWCSLFYCE